MDIIIETPRTFLRQFTIEDVQAVYDLNANLEVQKYTGDELVSTVERAREIITNINFPDYEKYGYGRWAVVHKQDTRVIGFAGLKYLPEVDETDIGYRFLPAYWGKGIATEVSRPIIDYGFDKLNLSRIIGIAMQDNIASIKVLEKIGLVYYKTDEYLGDGGAHLWYKLEKDHWMRTQ
jgi:RimJ/RimL family protein N-acetyltransferase